MSEYAKTNDRLRRSLTGISFLAIAFLFACNRNVPAQEIFTTPLDHISHPEAAQAAEDDYSYIKGKPVYQDEEIITDDSKDNLLNYSVYPINTGVLKKIIQYWETVSKEKKIVNVTKVYTDEVFKLRPTPRSINKHVFVYLPNNAPLIINGGGVTSIGSYFPTPPTVSFIWVNRAGGNNFTDEMFPQLEDIVTDVTLVETCQSIVQTEQVDAGYLIPMVDVNEAFCNMSEKNVSVKQAKKPPLFDDFNNWSKRARYTLPYSQMHMYYLPNKEDFDQVPFMGSVIIINSHINK